MVTLVLPVRELLPNGHRDGVAVVIHVDHVGATVPPGLADCRRQREQIAETGMGQSTESRLSQLAVAAAL